MACPAAGYQGYMLCCGKVLPYLNASIQKVTEKIMSAAIHGGGAASFDPVFNSEINFSVGQVKVEGDVTVEVFAGTGNYAAAFLNILHRAIPTQTDFSNVCGGFNTACPLIFSPGGGSEIVVPDITLSTAKALISSLDLKGNPGGNVQATFKIVAAGAAYNTLSTNAPATSALSFESVGTVDDSNPLPYYASNFTVTGSGETNLTNRITDWNLNITNNVTPIFPFNGSNEAADIVLGMRQVSGSFQYYSDTGNFVELLTDGASATISFGTNVINMPFLVFRKAPTPPSPGPNAAVIRTVEFSCVAKGVGSPSIYSSL